jgi:hypothetical protein
MCVHIYQYYKSLFGRGKNKFTIKEGRDEYMPKNKKDYKKCKPGDHIHILVTKNFTDVATEFFMICKDEHYNPSEVIRSSIADWVEKQKELQRILKERNIGKSEFMRQMAEAYEEAILHK